MPPSKVPFLLTAKGQVCFGDLGVPALPLRPGVPPPPSRRGLTIAGVSRDSTGAALPSCTCDLLRGNPDGTYTHLETTTSDGAGAYAFSVVGPGQRYRVLFYLAGSPNRAGTTDLNLEGE